jgi:hypothetical protein
VAGNSGRADHSACEEKKVNSLCSYFQTLSHVVSAMKLGHSHRDERHGSGANLNIDGRAQRRLSAWPIAKESSRAK